MVQIDKNRIVWHSRRGMLELDLLLEPFARECFERLTPAQQALYQQLLSNEDQDLYAWLLQRQEPDDPSLQAIIGLILDRARNGS